MKEGTFSLTWMMPSARPEARPNARETAMAARLVRRIAEAVLEGQHQVDVGHVGYGAHRAHGQVNGAEQ